MTPRDIFLNTLNFQPVSRLPRVESVSYTHLDVYKRQTPLSGHNAVEALLQDKNMDALVSPISYHDRNEGGLGGFMSPVDAVQSAGKLWIVEDLSLIHIFHSADGGQPAPLPHRAGAGVCGHRHRPDEQHF